MDVYKQFLSLSSFTALNHFSRILLTLFLARLLSAEQFGTFGALLALCEILLLPASMGFSASLMRLSYPLYKAQQHDLLQGLKRVYLVASCLFGILLVSCVVATFSYVSPHQTAKEHIFYLLLLVPVGAIMQSQAAFLIALNKTKVGLFTQQCLFEILTTLFCFMVFMIGGGLSLAVICQLLFSALVCGDLSVLVDKKDYRAKPRSLPNKAMVQLIVNYVGKWRRNSVGCKVRCVAGASLVWGHWRQCVFSCDFNRRVINYHRERRQPVFETYFDG
ncbi:oligosaccharide flippase family protein [Pseudoalteromonas arctica]|uniref:Oligosaccharide flippase family protein n=1 Tax=Pseudoalteromonas arctica TaxID=394751 RepID=A0A7Y0DSS9_9GAMM|nr:oligosaccharide flippase family protein [Pseudoalteromonas arctica]NMM40992.1 oligosaccharide flippase family protein [Pseudoalteromonas arctica]